MENSAFGSRKTGLFSNSTYSLSFKLMHDIGYWDTDVIPEDYRIFFKAFFKKGGHVYMEPMFLKTSMDAPLSSSYVKSLKKNIIQRNAVAARGRAVARPEALGERFLAAPGSRLAARSVGPREVQARHRGDAEPQAPQSRPGIRHGHAVLLWRQLSSGGPRRPHRGRAHR